MFGDLEIPGGCGGLANLSEGSEGPRARQRGDGLGEHGLYPAFGHNLCYPQVLPNLKWEDEKAQSLVLGRGQTRSRKMLGVMNDAMLGADKPFLCGGKLSLADYMASGIISLGELTGCDFSPWPNVARWYQRMQALPNWQKANAPLYAWAQHTKGGEYVRV